MKQKQRIHADVTTDGEREPVDIVTELLAAAGIDVEDVYGTPAVRLAEPNRERLIALAQWAAGEDAKRRLGLPNEWDQVRWISRASESGRTAAGCDTACCIAGKVALEDGGKPIFGWQDVTGQVRLPNGSQSHVRDYAQKALGLIESQADRLFDSHNDLDDVLALIAEFIGTELEDS